MNIARHEVTTPKYGDSVTLRRTLPISAKLLWPTALIMVIAAIVRVIPLTYDLKVIDQLTLVDDTYLSLEVAKNIGMGKGPLYGDEYTNGYQPLYVLLAAPIYYGLDPNNPPSTEVLDTKVKQALLLLVAFDLGSLILLGLLLSRHFGWSLPTHIGMLLWALHPLVITNSLNGLETPMAAFFLLLAMYYFTTFARNSSHTKPRLILGFILGFAVLARIDLAILGFVILVTETWDLVKGRWSLSQAITGLGLTFVGFVTIYSPWLLWSYSYTGEWLPVSGEAVRYQALIKRQAVDGLALKPAIQIFMLALITPIISAPTMWLSTLAIWTLTGLSLFTKSSRWAQQLVSLLKKWWVLAAFCGLLLIAYGFYIIGQWFFHRYLFALVLLPIITLSTGAFVLTQVKNNLITRGLLVAATLIICLGNPNFLKLERGEFDPKAQGFRSMGIWVNEMLPEGSRVGSTQTGGLSYYGTKLKVTNLDGVVNRRALTALKAKSIDSYMQEQQLEYMVDWKNRVRMAASRSSCGRKLGRSIQVTHTSTFESWNYSKWFLYKVRKDRPFCQPTLSMNKD